MLPQKETAVASYFQECIRKLVILFIFFLQLPALELMKPKKELAGKTSVFAGHSGAGNSSLITAILDAKQRRQENFNGNSKAARIPLPRVRYI